MRVMDDLISRQAAIDAIEEYADRLQMVDWKENPGVPYKAYALNWCINTIRDLPSAQPTIEAEPVRRGRWTRFYYREADFSINCSLCDNPVKWRSPYCPWCGAKMEEQE